MNSIFKCLFAACFWVTALSAAEPKILNYGNGAEPQDLDPQVIVGVPEQHLMLALSEGLVCQDPDGNSVAPGAAASWDISDDGLTYTFHLQPEGKWSDGRPVVADDFVRSFQRMLTPSLLADYAYMLFVVKNGESYFRGQTKSFDDVGFKALDPRTLQITLAKPTPFFLRALTHHSWNPVPIHVVEKSGGLAKKGTAWTRPGNFVGNGPFRLKEWKPSQTILVERNPHYWDAKNVRLDGIRFFPIEFSDVEERMFRAGQLDITYEVPPAKIQAYQKKSPELIRVEPYCGVYFYRFNAGRKPFDDVRVRKALALAIDRELLVDRVSRGGQAPAYSIIPPGVAGYQSDYRLTGSVEDAKRLLSQAGFPGGAGFPRVQLLYNALEVNRAVAEAIQQMWKKNLGIEIGLYSQEWKVYLDSQKQTDFDIQRAGWIADYVDPHVFLDLWETGNTNNNSNWGNARYDALLRRSLDSKTEAERYSVYREMERILVDELPVMPIYFYTRTRLLSPRVLNFRITYLDNYPWKYVDLKN